MARYDAEADRIAGHMSFKAARDDARSALRAAHEAGRREGAEEMRGVVARVMTELGEGVVACHSVRDYVGAAIRASTSPETLPEAAARVGAPPDGVLAVGPGEEPTP